MIFSRGFDKSLYLILASNGRNKEEIFNFIGSIPDALCEQIRETLVCSGKDMADDLDVLDNDETNMCGVCVGLDNCKYWFNIDMFFGTLSIGRTIEEETDIEVTLYSSSQYNKKDDYVLGYVNFGGSKPYCSCYQLSNTLFGKMIVSSVDGKSRKYRRIDTLNIPEDVNVNDLNNKNRLVHRKIKY